MQQYEFGSAAWIDAIHRAVRDLMRDADLNGIEFSSSEEFTDPPAHIAVNGRSGWHLIVSGGELTLGLGPLDSAERQVKADYATIKPLVPVAYRDNPDGEAMVKAKAADALAKGLLSAKGDRSPSALFPQLAPLHDLVADFTAR